HTRAVAGYRHIIAIAVRTLARTEASSHPYAVYHVQRQRPVLASSCVATEPLVAPTVDGVGVLLTWELNDVLTMGASLRRRRVRRAGLGRLPRAESLHAIVRYAALAFPTLAVNTVHFAGSHCQMLAPTSVEWRQLADPSVWPV